MKIETIKAALRYYATSAECSNDERNNVFEALDELAETAERYEDATLWKNDVMLVPLPTLIGVLNEMTYDDYGKLARIHKGSAPFEYYTHAVRRDHDSAVAMLTDRQLRGGYDLINDLWSDNDNNGAHNDDGTFNHNTSDETTDLRAMYTDNGIKVLFEIISPVLDQLLKETENDSQVEPANERLAVLSRLYETLNDMIN